MLRNRFQLEDGNFMKAVQTLNKHVGYEIGGRNMLIVHVLFMKCYTEQWLFLL